MAGMAKMAENSRTSSWVAALLMIVGTLLVGLAMIFTSWWVFGAGIIVGLAGLVLAMATNIMADTH